MCDAGLSGVALVFWRPCFFWLLMACLADEKTTDLSPATEGRQLALLSFCAFETWADDKLTSRILEFAAEMQSSSRLSQEGVWLSLSCEAVYKSPR